MVKAQKGPFTRLGSFRLRALRSYGFGGFG